MWGPEADLEARPIPVTSGPAAPSTEWFPAPSPSADAVRPAPASERRWEPTVGGPAERSGWGGPPGPTDIGIDERAAPAPRQPIGEQFGGRWAQAGIVAAVLAMVIVVIAVASGSNRGGDAATATSVARTSTSTATTTPRTTTTTTAPTTTEAPTTDGGPAGDVDPADLDPEHDPRVMLTEVPDAYEAVDAHLMLDNQIVGGLAPSLLFVADDSTWSEGPWVQVGSAADATFIGPVISVDLGGGRSGRLGTSQSGAEMVAIDLGGAAVAVSALGLSEGTAAAIASGLAVSADGSWSVPGSALPAGLRLAGGDLADSLSLRSTSSASVNYQGPDGVGLFVYATLADPGYDPLTVAPFFLSNLVYVTIGAESGIMGTVPGSHGSVTTVQWRHLGVDIQLSGQGMGAPELLAMAAHAATRSDGGWSEETWQTAEDGRLTAEPSEPVRIGDPLTFGDVGGGTVEAQRRGSALSWWIDGSTGFSIGRYGQDAPPILLQVASNPYPANGTRNTSYVVALALGDASIDGATLRVRTGASVSGAEGNGGDYGAIVHTIGESPDDAAAGAPSAFGYTLGAAVSAPWPEGEFLAELIAADGVTVLATATRADLL